MIELIAPVITTHMIISADLWKKLERLLFISKARVAIEELIGKIVNDEAAIRRLCIQKIKVPKS